MLHWLMDMQIRIYLLSKQSEINVINRRTDGIYAFSDGCVEMKQQRRQPRAVVHDEDAALAVCQTVAFRCQVEFHLQNVGSVLKTGINIS